MTKRKKKAKKLAAKPEVYFRTWICGKMRQVRLDRGEFVEFNSGGPTDEGYHNEWAVVGVNDDGTVCITECVDAQDCDGRIRRVRDYYTPMSNVTSKHPRKWKMNWTQGCNMQRDYSAEAMGY